MGSVVFFLGASTFVVGAVLGGANMVPDAITGGVGFASFLPPLGIQKGAL